MSNAIKELSVILSWRKKKGFIYKLGCFAFVIELRLTANSNRYKRARCFACSIPQFTVYILYIRRVTVVYIGSRIAFYIKRHLTSRRQLSFRDKQLWHSNRRPYTRILFILFYFLFFFTKRWYFVFCSMRHVQ